MFQNYLICTDLFDGLQRLVHFIPSLAAGGMKQVVFLHSVPFTEGNIPKQDERKIEAARERLALALENPPEGIDVKVEVTSGSPTDNILRTASANGTDLILLGASTRNLLTERLFGSTVVDLSQQTQIPVMTLPTALMSAFTREELDFRCRHLYRYILIPFDGGEASNLLIQKLKEHLQKSTNGYLEKCCLAWVLEGGGRRELQEYQDAQLQSAQKTLASIQADLEQLGLEVEVDVRMGEPVVDILEIAQMSDVCAIAISSNSLGKFWKLPIPSFTGEVLRRSCEPVLFFPARVR